MFKCIKKLWWRHFGPAHSNESKNKCGGKNPPTFPVGSIQSENDTPLKRCPSCGSSLKRLFLFFRTTRCINPKCLNYYLHGCIGAGSFTLPQNALPLPPPPPPAIAKKDKRITKHYSPQGAINVETGEIYTAVTEKDKTQFIGQPWYKRIFAKKPREVKYLGITTLTEHWIWSSTGEEIKAAVYKEFNPFTGEIYSVWAKSGDRKLFFNVDVFKKEGRLIE